MDNYLQILAQPTPPRSVMKSRYIQHCFSSGSVKRGNTYIDSNPGTPVAESNETSMILGENTDLSAISGIFELENKVQSSFTKGDFTNSIGDAMNTTALLDIDPSTCFTDSLYEDFLDFFISFSGEHEIFNLLKNYEELCCKHIEKLKKVLYKTVSPDNKFHKTAYMLRFLQEERNTWRLLRTLFQDRLDAENMDESEIMLEALGKKFSDKQIVDNLYQRNSYVRQSQLIIDWLEKNAADDYQDTFYNKFEYFTDNCLALEHSLNDLTTNPDINKNHKHFSGVQMDPDAYLRQKNYPLHEIDRENEARLFKYMFVCIRAGNLDQAQQLAERFGEPWLAAALEGWRLSHDSNYENENLVEGQKLYPVEGNKYRDIWKAACWAACQAPTVPVHEQAVYGSLCGNLKSMLAVCKTWEDCLWAYVRTSLDKLIEKEIRNTTQQERAMEDIPVEYWDKVLDIEDIFQELEACDSNDVKSESKSVLHIMQKYIILNDLDGLIEEMYSWLNTIKLDGHILRSMVHLILFLRVIGQSSKEELCIPILEAYVQELIKSKKISLVAPYTSTLPKEQQIIWYAKFLEGITDNTERQKCLDYAGTAGLDVSQITKTVVRNIREKGCVSAEQMTDLSAITTEDDLNKINAIDWLIFDPHQRAEAMKQANALMRIFLIQRKIEASKQVFAKVPSDSVAVMMQLAKAKGHEELLADDDNATREYLCFKAYLEAMDAFNDWFHHSIHAKPKEPLAPSGDNVTFKEKVAHEHELQQYKKDMERWRNVVSILSTTASDCLYNVLLFINGGWMVDQRSDGTVDENRQLQMCRLRKTCIPHVTRLLQDLLINEGKHKEAVSLADIVSSERYQLYKEFTHEDIKQFLRVTLDSSFALLDKNLDPLGYNYQ